MGIYTSRFLFRYAERFHAERFQKVLEELTNRSSLRVGENSGMYSYGQCTGDPIIHKHSTYEFMCRSLLFFYTSMGSVLQGGCYSSIWFVFYEKGAVVCSYSVHNRGGDVIGRYDIFVKTVLLTFCLKGLSACSCALDFSLPAVTVSL